MFPSKRDTDINNAITNACGNLEVATEVLLPRQCELLIQMEKVCKWNEYWLACTNLNMVSCTYSRETVCAP